MNTKSYLLLALCVALLLAGSGIVPGVDNARAQDAAPSSGLTGVNLADRARLEPTTQIVIYRRADCALSMRVYLGSIDDADTIAQFVEALDKDVGLRPRAPRPSAYEIAFHLQDGAVQRFDYDCCLASPTYLHGNQAFFQGGQAIAPDAFNALMAATLDTLAAPECSPMSK